MLVVDASVVIAALVQKDADGIWAEEQLATARQLAAPHLLPVEVGNALRRFAQDGSISSDVAALAHDELLLMPISYFAYEPVAERAWALRDNVRLYDAWYVALAELLEAPLATLDARLSRAAGPRCKFVTPRGKKR